MIFPSLIVLGTFFLSITESNITIEHLLFEVVSAFATVGLSMDVTPRLSEGGRIIIELLMFIGRLGPLTLVVLLSAKERPRTVTYAEEPILVG
jgi:trk system potassium uptake protein TrkH